MHIISSEINHQSMLARRLLPCVGVVAAKIEHRRDPSEVVSIGSSSADHHPTDLRNLARRQDRTLDRGLDRIGNTGRLTTQQGRRELVSHIEMCKDRRSFGWIHQRDRLQRDHRFA